MIHSGSVRADLFGGTIDLDPIGLILSGTKTLNIALSLKAEVKIEKHEDPRIKIISKDYNSSVQVSLTELKEKNCFKDKGPLSFLISLVSDINPEEGLDIEVSSKAPPGSGLGGSSSLGVVFYQGLLKFLGKVLSSQEIITRVKNIEAVNLNCGPTGFQDYYPALHGGVLALSMQSAGVHTEQLYNESLKEFFENHLMLVYSGQTRFSGINNWEVYKGFFDGDEHIRKGFDKLASLSAKAYESIISKNYKNLISLFKQEALARKELFPSILTPEMVALSEEKDIAGKAHLKICGAGGGGCFLMVLENPELKSLVREKIKSRNMQELDFGVSGPIDAN